MPIILTYHHITNGDSDPGYLCVSPRRFADQLDALSTAFTPVPLSRLVRDLQSNRASGRTVAVTFDDGYVNHLNEAMPLLERYDVPATVFVTAGPVPFDGAFWWDELEALLLSPGPLPERFDASVGGHRWRHELGDGASYTEATSAALRNWKAWDMPPTGRHALYVLLRDALLHMSSAEQRATMECLRTWAGRSMNGPASRHRLSPDELLVLSSCELVDIGAHTVTHPRLSSLPEGRQRWEIGACKAHLEQILGVPVSSFAYPYGDYSPTTITIVQDARFELACSTKPAIVRGAVDRFDLPRFHVHDMDAEEFLGWLAAAPVGF